MSFLKKNLEDPLQVKAAWLTPTLTGDRDLGFHKMLFGKKGGSAILKLVKAYSFLNINRVEFQKYAS